MLSRRKVALLALFGSVPAWLVSLILHMVAVPTLAFITIASLEEGDQVVVVSDAATAEEEVEIFEDVEIEPVEELEIEEFSAPSLVDPGAISFGDLASVAEVDTAGLGPELIQDSPIGDIGDLLEKGNGMSTVEGGLKAAASFFGTKSVGNRFVFVVDNSNSMGGGRFETALNEMMNSVGKMTEQQYFYVIFFSDTAYSLFHPEPAERMVPATDKNKQRLMSWLYTVEMCLRTNGEEAVARALSMNPDVIYILGDGAFGDKTGAILTAPHNRRTVIHTLGMEVAERGKKELEAIAKANKGTYTLVGTHPDAKAMAKAKPIPKNRTRGSVWGIKLPLQGKKKK